MFSLSLSTLQFALAQPLTLPVVPEQNVIFITLDGVRYRDVFFPEDRAFLEKKNGYPLHEFQLWSNWNGGFVFGTQEDHDEMEVGNSSALSLPGYKAIFTGWFQFQCTDNYNCSGPNTDTLVDVLYDEWKDPRKIALFSSWNQLRYATEGIYGARVTQSLGLHALQNFKVQNKTDQEFMNRYLSLNSIYKKDLPGWENARKDLYTWTLATDYLKTFHPRFTYISLLDTDEWAHDDERDLYFRTLNSYDEMFKKLISELQSGRHRHYMQNTSIVITTDHGRGGNSFTFSEHGENQLGIDIAGSENVWTYIIPSASLRESFRILRSSHGYEKKYSQLDIRPTIQSLLRLKPRPSGAKPQFPAVIERMVSRLQGESLLHFSDPKIPYNPFRSLVPKR